MLTVSQKQIPLIWEYSMRVYGIEMGEYIV